MSGALTVLGVACGAGLGAALRHGAEVLHGRLRERRRRAAGVRPGRPAPSDGALPWATLTVNVVGSALVGLVIALGSGGSLGPAGVTVLAVGLAGGLTTFSTLAFDVVTLARAHRWRAALGYALATLALGLAAAAAGHAVGQHV